MLLTESTYEFSREFREAIEMDPRINISWGDWMVAEDVRRKEFYLNLSNEEWQTVAKNHLRSFIGDIRAAMAWVARVQGDRDARAKAQAEARTPDIPTALDITFRAWKDMVEEPWKYGDDEWEDWFAMDEELWNSPKRWRVAAFWQEKQDAIDAVERAAFRQMLVDAQARFEHRMATRIQAAWRGHELRDTHKQLNCGLCLAQRHCRFKEDGIFICNDCADEEAPKCKWCFATLDDDHTEPFCDHDCYIEYMNESWRD
jgi:hypothetical protein